MTRKRFLTVVALVALAVGLFALAFPSALLASKGVVPAPATEIWVRQTGLLIFASGVATFLVRADGDSPTLRSLLLASAVLQIGLLPIELGAYLSGTIPRLAGVVPNSIFHVLAGFGFAYFALTMRGGLAARVTDR
jgi:hypothetical protein